jgi:hypothetical protein
MRRAVLSSFRKAAYSAVCADFRICVHHVRVRPCSQIRYTTVRIQEIALRCYERGWSVQELRLNVATYNGNLFPDDVKNGVRPEFGSPHIPVLIREAGGVRIVLGSHDSTDLTNPDIQIERQPNGWMIFLHPLPGSDASGFVYFLDDGRSFVQPEYDVGPTTPIQVVQSGQRIPNIHGEI